MLVTLKYNRKLWVGLFSLSVIAFACLGASGMTRYQPNLQVSPATNRFLPPSAEHWFGTDQFGRDTFSRVLHGGRISLLIALSVVCVSVLFGTLYGAISGYVGKLWDQILMRVVDMALSFPVVFLAVTLMALFGTGLVWLIWILVITSWMDIARLVRAEVHALKQRPFILRARATGLSAVRIVLHHLIPNAFATVLAVAVIRVADVILIESALSFLGLGVHPPVASWGSIINDGRPVLASAWWLTAFPGLAIATTTVSLHLVGEGLQSYQR
ncbi:MAG: ABC transporter permease [bacterium]